MPNLIINADDFGFNCETSDGILRCHEVGSVTSTTLMVNMPSAEYAAQRAKGYPDLSVGLHLNITVGKPLADPSDVQGLVNDDGEFLGMKVLLKKARRLALSVTEIEREFTLQVEKALDIGCRPTHFDSHQNVTCYPQPFLAMLRVAKRFAVTRLRTFRGSYALASDFRTDKRVRHECYKKNTLRSPKILYFELMHRFLKYSGYSLPDEKVGFYKVIAGSPLRYTISDWRILMKHLGTGTSELVAHPGLLNSDPLDSDQYRTKRLMEYEFYSNPDVINICGEEGVNLVNFTSL